MDEQMKELDLKIHEIAGRIKELREIVGLSIDEMAQKTDVSPEEYAKCEAGLSNLTFAFIYRCAIALNVDVTDIIEGSSPTLNSYTVTRAGKGQHIDKAHGMTYYNLAASFRKRIAEPLFVRAEYSLEAQNRDIELTTHTGQECDIVIKGTLKVQVGNHQEILHEGDSIYYDSSTPHGMIAIDGGDCLFYAIVLNPNGEDIREITHSTQPVQYEKPIKKDETDRIYTKFVNTTEDENGLITAISFNHEDTFNFAFDVVDELGRTKPDKLAMLHISRDHEERRFTFGQIKRASAQCANYFKALGIKKGDRVMLVLKRHYQFWFAMLGLNKLGAIAIPASNQLRSHDFEYRFEAAGITAIIASSDQDIAEQIEIAEKNTNTLKTKIIVGNAREGWHNFN